MFRLGDADMGRKMKPSGNLSFGKQLWLDGCLGLEPRWMGFPCLKTSAVWRGNHFG
jgi:hypothetical protein